MNGLCGVHTADKSLAAAAIVGGGYAAVKALNSSEPATAVPVKCPAGHNAGFIVLKRG
jgi:hypothetical protein